MMIKNATRMLAVLGFCLVSAGLQSTAHAAGFTIEIDCRGDGGLPNWAHTPNTITVKALIHGFYLDIASFTVPASKCDQENEIILEFAGFSYAEVDAVQVSTNGTDVFWIDELWLLDSDPANGWSRWGTDNNVGYCISKQSGDGANAYCLGGKAYGTNKFTK